MNTSSETSLIASILIGFFGGIIGGLVGINSCIDNHQVKKRIEQEALEKKAVEISTLKTTNTSIDGTLASVDVPKNGKYLDNTPRILEPARVLNVTQDQITLIFQNKAENINYYQFQQVTAKTGTYDSSNVITLATKETLPVIPGLSYKIFYHSLRKGDVLDEAGLYFHALNHQNTAQDDNKRGDNVPLYNRKFKDVAGVIDSMRLIK